MRWLVPIFVAAALGHGSQAPPQDDLRSRIPARRQFSHAARIMTDPQPATGRVKLWILPGADDMRLYTPKGGQLEMDFQVSYWLRQADPRELPASIEVRFESHGETRPGPVPHALTLLADGRRLTLQEQPDAVRRSGALVFYGSAAKMSLAEFLTLVNASRVEGRWLGHDFVLIPPQLEILRDLASRMGGTHPVAADRRGQMFRGA